MVDIFSNKLINESIIEYGFVTGGLPMFLVLNKSDNTTHKVKDLLTELQELFPNQNKHFHNLILSRLNVNKIWNNNQFTITLDSYSPEKIQALVKKTLISFKNIPKNTSNVKRDTNYNQWLLFNSQNGKHCVFNNLAAVARAINVDYAYLYNGICKNSVFNVDKYRFSRNTIYES
jgi:hypothetical protein